MMVISKSYQISDSIVVIKCRDCQEQLIYQLITLKSKYTKIVTISHTTEKSLIQMPEYTKFLKSDEV